MKRYFAVFLICLSITTQAITTQEITDRDRLALELLQLTNQVIICSSHIRSIDEIEQNLNARVKYLVESIQEINGRVVKIKQIEKFLVPERSGWIALCLLLEAS